MENARENPSLLDILKDKAKSDYLEEIKKYLRDLLLLELKREKPKESLYDKDIVSLGMDSLRAVLFKNKVESSLQ